MGEQEEEEDDDDRMRWDIHYNPWGGTAEHAEAWWEVRAEDVSVSLYVRVCAGMQHVCKAQGNEWPPVYLNAAQPCDQRPHILPKLNTWLFNFVERFSTVRQSPAQSQCSCCG